jgi:hypothetical protein
VTKPPVRVPQPSWWFHSSGGMHEEIFRAVRDSH